MEENRIEKQLDLMTLVVVLKKFWIFILIATVLVATMAGILTSTMTKPTYTSKFRLYVNPQFVSSTDVSASHVSVAVQATAEFAKIIPNRTTIYSALSTNGAEFNLNYDENGGEALVSSVMRSVSAATDGTNSQSIVVTVRAQSPARAYEIAKTLEKFLPQYLSKEIASDTVKVKTVDVALPATHADSIHLTRNVILAGMAAAALAYLAFLTYQMLNNELTDDSILTDNYAEIPVLGRIPTWGDPGRKLFKQQKKQNFSNASRDYTDKLLTQDTPFAITESFKTFRSNVSYSTGSAKCPVIAGTSVRKAAGKTVVLSNLAVSYAQLGKKVMIIEADMRIPALHKVFGLKKGNGLSEILAGIAPDYTKCIRHTEVEGLDTILSGKIPPNPSELLSSEKLGELLSALREQYDMIIIDLPPYAGLTDASVIAPLVDGYLLITRIGHTNLRELRYGFMEMNQVGMKILGFVVNDMSSENSHYYSYYRYRYKSSYSSEYGTATASVAAQLSDANTTSPEAVVAAPVVETPKAEVEAPVADAPKAEEEVPATPKKTTRKKAAPKKDAE